MTRLSGIRHWLVIGLATTAALTGNTEGPWSMAATLALLACALVAARPAPEALLPALFPLVFMLPPAPPAVGWREGAYAVVTLCAGAGTLVCHHVAARQFLWRGRWWWAAGAALLGLNYVAAVTHGVPLSDWLRGLVPFVFLLVAIPATIALRQQPALVTPLLAAAMIAAILFAGNTLYRYLSGSMWVPGKHVQPRGPSIAPADAPAAMLDALVEIGIDRVAWRDPRTTDVLLPLAFVWAAWMAMWARQQAVRSLGFAIGAGAAASVIITYTRSMVMVAVVAGAVIVTDAFLSRRRARAMLFAALVAVVAVSVIAVFNLQTIYGVRLVQLAASARALATNLASGEYEAPVAQNDPDVNVTIRVQEIEIAWRMFLASPVYGQGLGVRHPLRIQPRYGGIPTVEMVAYLHNWPLYMLMVGGVVGAAAYAALLLGAPLVAWRRADPAMFRLVSATVLVLATYGAFFAVFRLIPFNLVLGGVWALALTRERERRSYP